MKIEVASPEAYQLFHEGALAFAQAEREGIRIDIEYCRRKKEHLERKIKYYQKHLEDTKLYKRWFHIYKNKINIHSNQQLSKILYQIMKIEPTKTTETGQGSTDEDALRRLNVEGIDLILAIRKLTKVKNTYLEAFMREQFEGFIHPSFNLHNVRTYRSSSNGPNFQNIPKRDKEAMKICRRAILPRPGHMLIEADFSALEVNISECYHKDPVMMKYLLDDASDMHLDMAKQIFIMDEMNKKIPSHGVLRQGAKNGFVFPQFYGDYYGNNARGLIEWAKLPAGKWKDGLGIELPDGTTISTHLRARGIKSFDHFVDHIKAVEDDFWNRRFRQYGAWRKKAVKDYQRRGWLKLHTGFVCSGVMRKNEIVNYPIQGSAFHCLLFTFIELNKTARQENWKSKIVGQIHDSILIDTHPSELAQIKDALRIIVKEKLPAAWKWIIVPLEIDIDEYGVDQSWVS